MPSNTFKVGEMLNKRTPNTKTWMNFDGSYTTEIHSGIVHFDDGLNNLHNINTSLFDEADADTYEGPTSGHGKNMLKHEKEKVKDKKKQGKMNRDDFDYQVPTLPFSCQIPKNIKKGYSIGQNDEFVRFIPQNVSPSKGYVNKAKNNEIQYQDAWNDTDIILEVTDRGIKETMILKTDRAPFAFSFEIDGVIEDDLTMGSMKLEPAWLIDAVGERRDVSQSIRREGEQTYIDLVADVEGLIYPIEIDPTVTLGTNDFLGDTWLEENNPGANQNGSSSLWLRGGTGTKRDMIIKFNLNSIPLGSVVTLAQLSINSDLVSGTGTAQVRVKPLLGGSSLSSITWNNCPISDEVAVDDSTLTFYTGQKIFVATKALDYMMKNGVDYGFRITSLNTNLDYHRFEAKEAGTGKTSLIVTYNQPPTAPTVTTPNGGETWNSSHTVEWLGGIDIENTSAGSYVTSSITSINSTYSRGQSFFTPNKPNIKLRDFSFVQNTGAGATFVDISLYEVNANGTIGNLVQLVRDNLYIPSNASPTKLLIDNIDIPLLSNSQYAILLSLSSGSDLRLYNVGNFTFNGSSYFNNHGNANGWIRDEGFYDYAFDFNFGVGGLQHQIQLSTDNGVNWSDIVALTSAGVTQYIHDFINAPQTSTAKIRIRAFDGSAYGPWDESNGVFSIIHNVAPSAPTNLTPVTTKDRAELIRFAWQHNDPNADAQSKFDLDYRLQGSTTWNTVTQNTINQFYDLPAGILPRGTIEWRVRTYDQADLSGPYSELKTFFAGDKPSKPTTVSPVDSSIVSVSNPTVEWSSVGQVGYNLKVFDATETSVLWESNQTSNNKAHTIGYSLENETDYVIQLTIKNVDGISSNIEKSHIHVSYTPPAIPVVEILEDEERGSIIINITNPAPTGTEPLVMFNEIYRKSLNEEWIRIADDVLNNDSLTDYTPASGKIYEYYVRSWGSNETFLDSAVFQASVSFEHAQLALASDYSEWVELVYNKDTSRQKTRGRTLNQFAGRPYPLADFGDENTQSIALSYITKDYADVEHFYSIADRQETMLYRDREGRREFVTIDVTSEAEQYLGEIFSISFTVEKVWFKEGV